MFYSIVCSWLYRIRRPLLRWASRAGARGSELVARPWSLTDRRASGRMYFIAYLYPVKDVERRAMEIFLLCCVGWLVVLVFVLCLLTVGKWADEDSVRSRKEV